jgi:hypothetical protein
MTIRILAAALVLATGACTVEQTGDGAPGEVPEYEVRPADVNVDWDTTQVRVPDIDITPHDTAARPLAPADTQPR